MTSFWYVIFALGVLAAIINLSIAVVRRKRVVAASVRGLAGLLSLALAVGIVLGKLVLHAHPPFVLQWQTVFIGTGVFVFAVLWLPSYVDSGTKPGETVTMQERAARPANATVRLQNSGADEWVN